MKPNRRNCFARLTLAAAFILTAFGFVVRARAALPLTPTPGGSSTGFGPGMRSPSLDRAALDQKLTLRTPPIDGSGLDLGPAVSRPTFNSFATNRAGNVGKTLIQLKAPEPPPARTGPTLTVSVNGRGVGRPQPDMGYVNSLTDISGTVTDNDPIDHVEIRIYRSNGQEAWNGTAWAAPAAGVPAQRLTLNGPIWGTWGTVNLPNGVNLVEGNQISYEVKAVDRSGNSSVTNGGFNIDKTPPYVRVVVLWNCREVYSPSVVKGAPSIAMTALDNTGYRFGGAKLVLKRRSTGQYWNGSSWGSSMAEIDCLVNGMPVAYLWPAGTILPDDVYDVTAKVIDYAGNSATAQGSFTVDSVPPTVAITAPFAGVLLPAYGLTSISGTAQDAGSGIDRVTVVLYRERDSQCWFGDLQIPVWSPCPNWADPRAALTTTLNGNTWVRNKLPPISALIPGPYSLLVTAYDRSGKAATANIDFDMQ